MKKTIGMIYWLVLLFYIFLVIDTVFLSRDGLRSVNLIPFDSIKEFIMVDNGVGGHRVVDMNIWGNILMFVPAGIYIFLHSNRSLGKNMLILFILSLAIEVIQFVFSRGASDIDDIILNVFGGFVGGGIYFVFKKIFKTQERIKMAISILSLIVGLPVLILFVILFIAN